MDLTGKFLLSKSVVDKMTNIKDTIVQVAQIKIIPEPSKEEELKKAAEERQAKQARQKKIQEYEQLKKDYQAKRPSSELRTESAKVHATESPKVAKEPAVAGAPPPAKVASNIVANTASATAAATTTNTAAATTNTAATTTNTVATTTNTASATAAAKAAADAAAKAAADAAAEAEIRAITRARAAKLDAAKAIIKFLQYKVSTLMMVDFSEKDVKLINALCEIMEEKIKNTEYKYEDDHVKIIGDLNLSKVILDKYSTIGYDGESDVELYRELIGLLKKAVKNLDKLSNAQDVVFYEKDNPPVTKESNKYYIKLDDSKEKTDPTSISRTIPKNFKFASNELKGFLQNYLDKEFNFNTDSNVGPENEKPFYRNFHALLYFLKKSFCCKDTDRACWKYRKSYIYPIESGAGAAGAAEAAGAAGAAGAAAGGAPATTKAAAATTGTAGAAGAAGATATGVGVGATKATTNTAAATTNTAAATTNTTAATTTAAGAATATGVGAGAGAKPAASNPYNPAYVIPILASNLGNINEVIKHQIDRFRQLDRFLQDKNDHYVVIPGTYMSENLSHALGILRAKNAWDAINPTLFPNIKNNLDLLVNKLIEKWNTGGKTRVYIGHIGDYKSQTKSDGKENFEANNSLEISAPERLNSGDPQPPKEDNKYYGFPRSTFPPGPPSQNILHVYGANEGNWKLNTKQATFDKPIQGGGQVTYFKNKGPGPFGIVTMPVGTPAEIIVDDKTPVNKILTVGGFFKSRKFRSGKRINKTRKNHTY